MIQIQYKMPIILFFVLLYTSNMYRLINLSKQFFSAPPSYTYSFSSGSAIVPHPQKAYKGGEDALYIGPNVLLVADGVGGWAESGVDPAKYSKQLARLVEEIYASDPLRYITNPIALIEEAVHRNKETGSTTVCVLTLHPQTGVMRAYYLGDSVYAVCKADTIAVAQEQQIQFNFPVQVGTNGFESNSGVYVEYQEGDIKTDDVIVVATDGLWDNIHTKEIHFKARETQFTLKERAQMLANSAKRYGLMVKYQSPFYLKAKKANLRYPMKGKLDDNCVIVAQIIKETKKQKIPL